MDNFSDKILFKTRQHKIVFFYRFIKLFTTIVIPLSIILYFLFKLSIILVIITALFLSIFCFGWIYFFWSKSYLLITNKKISLKVRNGIFSKYHMSIYFKNIKDIAYAKNNVLHYMFDYGTIFARSSAGAGGDFEGPALPEIEKIYKYINNIYLLSEEKRDVLNSLKSLEENKHESEESIIEKEKNVLLQIQGIKEVVLLGNKDRTYIFDNEEERNHGVFECLRKKVLFAITHDSTFRKPDENIVLKKGEKVIFPTVKFHEIERNGVISSSPGIKVDNYLKNKFQNLVEDDASILVGFDI